MTLDLVILKQHRNTACLSFFSSRLFIESFKKSFSFNNFVLYTIFQERQEKNQHIILNVNEWVDRCFDSETEELWKICCPWIMSMLFFFSYFFLIILLEHNAPLAKKWMEFYLESREKFSRFFRARGFLIFSWIAHSLIFIFSSMVFFSSQQVASSYVVEQQVSLARQRIFLLLTNVASFIFVC
jgi:hypothetical protein